MADSVCLFGTIPREPREELVSYKMHNMCCEWIKTGYKDDCTLLFKYRVRVIDMLGEPSNWPDRKRSEKGVEWGWSQLKSSCGMDVVFDLSVLCHSSRTDTLPYILCKGGPSEKANDTSRFPWGCCCRVCVCDSGSGMMTTSFFCKIANQFTVLTPDEQFRSECGQKFCGIEIQCCES